MRSQLCKDEKFTLAGSEFNLSYLTSVHAQFMKT